MATRESQRSRVWRAKHEIGERAMQVLEAAEELQAANTPWERRSRRTALMSRAVAYGAAVEAATRVRK